MTVTGPVPVLVAALGNPDCGDDGVGPAAAARLRGRAPPAARIVACGGDVLALIEEWRDFADVILVDAAATPFGRPGRIHRLDLALQPPSDGDADAAAAAALAHPSTHMLGLAEAVALARQLGRLPRRLVAYLVEGECFAVGAPLSPAVAAAVDIVADRILGELCRIASGG